MAVDASSRITSSEFPYPIVNIAHLVEPPSSLRSSTESNDDSSLSAATMKSKHGRLSISMSPGKKDNRWNRNLADDLKVMKQNDIQVIVCLLEWTEMKALNIADYPKRAGDMGFLFYHLPIPDCEAPRQAEISVLIPILIQHLSDGLNILVHCRGGLGRAGTVCACCLCHFGYDGDDAIDIVRRQRPGAIQTKCQEQCILNYYQALSL